MAGTIASDFVARFGQYLDSSEAVIAAVDVRITGERADRDAVVDNPRFVLAITPQRLLCVQLIEGDGGHILDASVPVLYVSGVRIDKSVSPALLTVSVENAAQISFEVDGSVLDDGCRLVEAARTLAPDADVTIIEAESVTEGIVEAESLVAGIAEAESQIAGTADAGSAIESPIDPSDSYFLHVDAAPEPEPTSVEPDGTCPRCSTHNDPHSVFCHDCGTAL